MSAAITHTSPGMARVASFIQASPLAQWHRAKQQLDVASVIMRARARGLRLAPAKAVNSDAYEVYDHHGRFLRRGSLSSMQHFAERYQG